MSIILQSLGFEWPSGEIVFKNLNLSLELTKKYGLVGANGVGKSTLVKLIMNRLEPSSGKILAPSGIYLFQQQDDAPELTVYEWLASVDWAHPLGHKLLEPVLKDAYCNQLSGGQWTRVRLAKAVFSEPSFLILDEPTNNLDREGREALSEFVTQYAGGLLLISHDRELLEDVSEIIELTRGGLSHYGGPWSFYEEARARERESLSQALSAAKRKRDLSEKDRAAKLASQEKRMRQGKSKAFSKGLPRIVLGAKKRQAQQTLNRLDAETSTANQEAVQDAWRAFEAVKTDPLMYAKLGEVSVPAKQLVAEAIDLQFRYTANDKNVFHNSVNFAWRGPVRMALKGENGSGKSTLIKLLTGHHLDSSLVSGELRLGALKAEVLTQDHSGLINDLSVIESIRRVQIGDESELRNGLAKFLFQKDKVFQKVGSLSGGERLRLALAHALMSVKPPEFLILDEPTNNLDIENLEFLEELLKQYNGALLVVSHDQHFLDNINIREELYL